jgi:hypothetical protein
MLATDMDLAFENEEHVLGGGAFFKEDVAGVCDELLPMAREPEAIFKGKSMKGTDAFEGFGDFLGRGGRGESGDSWGEHPVTSGRSL